mmetsp:Transcript_46536/g.149379  ORF Transcript_46536/g.149379 Transcript_46536/m.149379 type:complete len:200 (-) Transcript_46536:305-904(-)
MASTTILAKKSESRPTILEDMDVRAQFMRVSEGRFSTGMPRCSSTYLHASRIASRMPLMMDVGWILLRTRSLERFRSSEAVMTTDVVPSPTSWSCSSASSTRIFAAGCSTSSCLRMVAPSLVMVTSPMSSTSILSRPTGPRDVLTMLAIARTAVTFWARTSAPEVRVPGMSRRLADMINCLSVRARMGEGFAATAAGES